MKCAYCGQPCTEGAYGIIDNEEYDVEINGIDITVYIHQECLPKILSQWIRDKIHPVLYGAPYDCTPKVTCGSVKWTYEPSVTCDTTPLSTNVIINRKTEHNYTTQHSGNDCCMNCEHPFCGPTGLHCDVVDADVFKGDTCNGFKRKR